MPYLYFKWWRDSSQAWEKIPKSSLLKSIRWIMSNITYLLLRFIPLGCYNNDFVCRIFTLDIQKHSSWYWTDENLLIFTTRATHWILIYYFYAACTPVIVVVFENYLFTYSEDPCANIWIMLMYCSWHSLTKSPIFENDLFL